MALKDISNGPDFVIWVVFALFLILSIVLLTGRGSWLIAGYNTASEEEKSKYDEKKLCRITGAGMSVITVMVLVMALGESMLPTAFVYVFLAVTIIDCVVIIVLMNTIGKKK